MLVWDLFVKSIDVERNNIQRREMDDTKNYMFLQ